MWQSKTKVLRKKHGTVPLYQLQIPHGLVSDITQASVVRSRWLETWAMAQLNVAVTNKI